MVSLGIGLGLRLGRDRRELREVGIAVHGNDVLGVFAVARGAKLLEGLVGGYDQIRAAIAQPFAGPGDRMADPAPVELGDVQLRANVVLVEDEFGAEQLVGQRDEKNQIGRVAGMNDVDAVPPPDSECQASLMVERAGVFEKEAKDAARLQGNGMPIDGDAVYCFLGLRMQRRLGANDADLPARAGQCLRFLPDASIEGDGEVFDNDQARGPPLRLDHELLDLCAAPREGDRRASDSSRDRRRLLELGAIASNAAYIVRAATRKVLPEQILNLRPSFQAAARHKRTICATLTGWMHAGCVATPALSEPDDQRRRPEEVAGVRSGGIAACAVS